ncbi:hypothetical protein NLU13_0172 [Sarocladium strictum]|uniref:F-box domain-containing protein n=1 Tax=Sarocladium strictum TaxID=5046 RepID=A0AA39GNJ5_SARSR|nr:hypothetical protein NLU13_0172 [Sarocladium strictum]
MPKPDYPGWWSDEEFEIREDQREAMIETLGLPLVGWERKVTHVEPREHLPILGSIATPFPETPTRLHEYGKLEMLPLEVTHIVLLRLDMQSIFHTRQTSSRLRAVVDSCRQYGIVAAHGLDLYCLLLRSSLAHQVSLRKFFYMMCESQCHNCQKCCWMCRFDDETSVGWVWTTDTVKKFPLYLDNEDLEQLRTFDVSVGPGLTPASRQRRKHTVVAAEDAAWLFAGDHPGYPDDPDIISVNYTLGYCVLPHFDVHSNTVDRGVLCLGCVRAWKPDRTLGVPETFDGAHERLYTRAEFVHHLKWCVSAQLFWEGELDWRTRTSTRQLGVLSWYI